MMECPFCRIAAEGHPHEVMRTDHLVAFLDYGPIRPGHLQIMPLDHYETFDVLPPDLAAHVVQAGQRLARTQKLLYSVDRVAFLFTGGDIPHAHAHLVPIVEKTDITSRRYIAETDLTFAALPRPPKAELTRERDALIETLEETP